MYYTGIDIGSTATKVVVFDEKKENILHKLMIPSGWNSRETSEKVLEWLGTEGVTPENSVIISTGYGRISVPYADKQITEITCHGKAPCFFIQKMQRSSTSEDRIQRLSIFKTEW